MKLRQHAVRRFRPDALALAKPTVEVTALPDHPANGGWLAVDRLCGALDFELEMFGDIHGC